MEKINQFYSDKIKLDEKLKKKIEEYLKQFIDNVSNLERSQDTTTSNLKCSKLISKMDDLKIKSSL